MGGGNGRFFRDCFDFLDRFRLFCCLVKSL